MSMGEVVGGGQFSFYFFGKTHIDIITEMKMAYV
jgi:hypothetical protein